MAFTDWKKRTKSFSLLPEGYRAMAERIAQAAYKAGERDGRKQVEQIAAQGAELAVMIERERCARLCDPANADRPDDWTEYAKVRAECAARIRNFGKEKE